MYHHNVKLSFKSFVTALLAVLLSAVAVSTQTTSPTFPRRPAINRADQSTINAQARPAIGATAANRQRPTVRDMIFSEQPPPERENPGRRIGKAERPAQQKVNPDRANVSTIPHWSDSYRYQGLTYKYTMVGTDPKRGSKTTTIPTVDMPIEDGMDATEAGRQNAHAGTIAVTSTADGGPGSLRQALVEAADGDTINITARGTITLTSGELIVDKSVTIRGPGAAKLSVSGNARWRVFHVTPNTTVTISGLTIANGRPCNGCAFPDSAGGGIYSDHAQLTVSNCTLSGNSAQFGAGIFSNSNGGGSASLTLNNTTISYNSASETGGGIFSGGGFFNTGPSGSATLTLNDSTVSGNSAEQAGGGIFNDGFSGSADMTAHNITLSDNHAGLGCGIYNNGDSGVAKVTLVDSTVSFNTGNGTGGGIYNDGTSSVSPGDARVTLINSEFIGNISGGNGGGIFNNGNGGSASLTLTSSDFRGNSAFCGGGIYNTEHDGSTLLTIADSDLSGNRAAYVGGGILNEVDNGSANVKILSSTLRDNSASADGGGIWNTVSNSGSLTLSLNNSTVSGNSVGFSGGGIYNSANDGSTTVTLNNSTLSGNSAIRGGGIYNSVNSANGGTATVTLNNSTLSGNSAVYDFGGNYGGGIYNEAAGGGSSAPVTLNNSTLSGNSASFGGGIFNNVLYGGSYGGSATLDMANTIFNAGASGENIYNDSGTVTSHGYNLSSDAAGGDAATGPGGLLNAPGDIRNTDPLLGPLQDNGGPTMTHALLLHSPAINAGDPNFNPNAFVPPLLYDQRDGPRFPRIVNGRIDIGAFESRHP